MDLDKINYNSMDTNNNNKYFNKSENNIVIVTAFFDIDRNKWSILNRSPYYYLESIKYLFNTENIIIAFIDTNYIEYIKKYINDSIFSKEKKIIIIPIDYDWLYTYSDSWKKNEISKKIMQSDEYIKKVFYRIKNGNPENIYSEYNTINHCKIDFIKYTIDNNLINENDLICWCDSGYYKSILHDNVDEFPISNLEINKFNLNKLNFCLRNNISYIDSDINYTLMNAPEIFTGSFFSGTSETMLKLYKLYHYCLDELYENNISDDDQHIYLRCFFKEPELFELFLSTEKWPQALNYFQKILN